MTENNTYIRSYYHCCCINEPVIFSHCVYLKLHVGHRFHALSKVCSDCDNTVSSLVHVECWHVSMEVAGSNPAVVNFSLFIQNWSKNVPSQSVAFSYLALCVIPWIKRNNRVLGLDPLWRLLYDPTASANHWSSWLLFLTPESLKRLAEFCFHKISESTENHNYFC